ncbi:MULTISPECIES: hypothetical protein [Paenibacillus]|uniref:hypothetical protein n=1 Tax=Paenibacillus TaxID=44249 RepID=UPI00048BE229|nr:MULTISPECIES: hypothetical protein [Paenibacillus]ODB61703.1 hypothetical protein A7309_14460 [Paenibacillus polymyxa]SFR15254.1 hypothetical protein SAMN04488603_10427 [Paenibacillus sp. cl130]
MSKSLALEWASMVYGPYDLPHMYEIFEGVLYKGCYFFYLDNGVLCLRQVRKLEQLEHTHLFIDGDSAGLQLAEGIRRDLMEVVSDIIRNWRDKSGLTFLFDELLCLRERGDIQLDLVKDKG